MSRIPRHTLSSSVARPGPTSNGTFLHNNQNNHIYLDRTVSLQGLNKMGESLQFPHGRPGGSHFDVSAVGRMPRDFTSRDSVVGSTPQNLASRFVPESFCGFFLEVESLLVWLKQVLPSPCMENLIFSSKTWKWHFGKIHQSINRSMEPCWRRPDFFPLLTYNLARLRIFSNKF